jgi:phosphoribosylformylglycinamidine cyclo-ligase
MALVGGETAQLPDMYHPGHYDLAGTIVGIVSEAEALHGDRVEVGDALVGYASTGLHTNGYTLARQIVFDDLGLDVGSYVGELGATIGDALLEVHRSYFACVRPVLPSIHALAHITGGGIDGNLMRSMPDGCAPRIDKDAWEVPRLFQFLQLGGSVDETEMFRVFNMGIGMIAVAPLAAVNGIRQAAEAERVATWVIGDVVRA